MTFSRKFALTWSNPLATPFASLPLPVVDPTRFSARPLLALEDAIGTEGGKSVLVAGSALVRTEEGVSVPPRETTAVPLALPEAPRLSLEAIADLAGLLEPELSSTISSKPFPIAPYSQLSSAPISEPTLPTAPGDKLDMTKPLTTCDEADHPIALATDDETSRPESSDRLSFDSDSFPEKTQSLFGTRRISSTASTTSTIITYPIESLTDLVPDASTLPTAGDRSLERRGRWQVWVDGSPSPRASPSPNGSDEAMGVADDDGAQDPDFEATVIPPAEKRFRGQSRKRASRISWRSTLHRHNERDASPSANERPPGVLSAYNRLIASLATTADAVRNTDRAVGETQAGGAYPVDRDIADAAFDAAIGASEPGVFRSTSVRTLDGLLSDVVDVLEGDRARHSSGRALTTWDTDSEGEGELVLGEDADRPLGLQWRRHSNAVGTFSRRRGTRTRENSSGPPAPDLAPSLENAEVALPSNASDIVYETTIDEFVVEHLLPTPSPLPSSIVAQMALDLPSASSTPSENKTRPPTMPLPTPPVTASLLHDAATQRIHSRLRRVTTRASTRGGVPVGSPQIELSVVVGGEGRPRAGGLLGTLDRAFRRG
ncbi:hypothetical protein BDK51DRAFT_44030 [Blyttiomyces helicus]|uniref:Uncharacterized protein n=1 Tax=Blyttiomyces helicus TaxID=388810 RepID=A0A4P9WI06_9FUNG|nr:hypothetical protein BDK51DRAFT_44030 [Blyttiomyces helicus]|eukprot:RKO92032.1 hypothetical protein BDK51DRAFT_44030 [Blyttiomyces helicus]